MTLQDPFASAPAADEAQAVSEAPVATPVVAATLVTQPGTTEIVMTFKEGAGFDTTWNVIHASSVQEARAILLDEEFKLLLDQQKRVASYFRGGSAPAQQSSPSSRPLQPGQPAGSVEAPSWAPPKPHDDFVYVTKVKADTGKPWHAWMPPGKGDSRSPLFFNPPR